MICYYNDEQATKEVLKDGWLYTGDMAMQDEEGFIFLVDRKKDVIISGGENLYPVQIEDFLSSHPDVMDVAVIGLPDSRLGEIAAAIVEIKEGHHCTEEESENIARPSPAISVPGNLFLRRCREIPPARLKNLYCDRFTAEKAWLPLRSNRNHIM